MTDHPFVPNPEQMALYPDVSGNSINGLGETEQRNPSYVYWGNDPDDVAHGAVQRWFYTVDPGLEAYGAERARRAEITKAPLSPLAAEPVALSDADVAGFVRSSTGEGHFDKFGVAAFDPLWAFEGVDIGFKNVVVLGFQHDYAEITKAPTPEGGLEVMRQYRRAAFGAKFVASWLRENGWEAEPLTGPMSGKMTMIPAALSAGFGELGKHGSIITPEFGSSFRLSAVLTDCPLPLSQPEDQASTTSAQAVRFAPKPVRRMRSSRPNRPCAGRRSGMSISTNACRSSTNTKAAPSVSPSARGAAPAWA